MTSNEIEAIKDEYLTRLSFGSVSHPWVPDGCYDDNKYFLRTFVYNHVALYYIGRLWVADDSNNPLPFEWMKKPWGSYPEFPPKPEKKK